MIHDYNICNKKEKTQDDLVKFALVKLEDNIVIKRLQEDNQTFRRIIN